MGVSSPADRWRTALDGLVPTPPEHRERLVGAVEAQEILRCGPDLLETMVREGLPVAATGPGGGPRFDYHDLINLGLYSGSGVSLGEVGERVLMRFASEPPERWTGARRWAVEVEHRCPAPGGGAGGWTAAAPAPEVSDGRCERWEQTGSTGHGAGGDAVLRQEGTIEVSGRRLAVERAAVRDVYRAWLSDIRSHRLRFQWLPTSLRLDPEKAYRLGLADCVSVSLMLERQLTSLGLEARTRKGHVVGLISVEHAWAEVRDDDGGWKFVDPVLAVVALRAGSPRPEFEEFCLGSIANRVIPWDRGAGEDLAAHGCGPGPGVLTAVAGAAAR